jgi:hypothetical protein
VYVLAEIFVAVGTNAINKEKVAINEARGLSVVETCLYEGK